MVNSMESEFNISPKDYEKYSNILNEHFDNFLFLGNIKGTKQQLAALDSDKVKIIKQIGNLMVASDAFRSMILDTVEIYKGFLESEAKKDKE